jgi:transcriptional regulator with XRE-family HTH domain
MIETDLKVIGARIKNLREDLIGDQVTMSKQVGITVKTISFVENGHSAPSQKMLSYLSEKYNVNPEWVTTGKGDRISNEVFDAKYVHNLYSKVVNLERELSEMRSLVETLITKITQIQIQ